MSTVKVGDTKYADVYNSYVKDGAVELSSGFSGIGSSGYSSSFNEGEIITLPNVSKVLGMHINGSQNQAEAIIVKVTCPNGAIRYQPFFPKSLAKRTSVLDIDAEGRVINQRFERTRGTAAEWYRQQNGRPVQDIVEDLIKMGKEIKVSKVELVDAFRFGSTDIIKTNLYTFDFV